MHSCKIFIVNEKMKHLCICQQPKNSDFLKVMDKHLQGAYELGYSGGGGHGFMRTLWILLLQL